MQEKQQRARADRDRDRHVEKEQQNENSERPYIHAAQLRPRHKRCRLRRPNKRNPKAKAPYGTLSGMLSMLVVAELLAIVSLRPSHAT